MACRQLSLERKPLQVAQGLHELELVAQPFLILHVTKWTGGAHDPGPVQLVGLGRSVHCLLDDLRQVAASLPCPFQPARYG